jgi:hypothetical protein
VIDTFQLVGLMNCKITDQCGQKLCQVSIGTQSVWALTASGEVHFRLGVVQPPPPHNPAWVKVLDDEKHPIAFAHVSASANDNLVSDKAFFVVC